LLPVFACLPLIFQLHVSFTDAYFESMSGLTTTGATVLAGLDKLPPSINLWRGMLVWLGGMGLIVLAVAVLPLLGIGGRADVQGRDPGTDEGFQPDPAHGANRQGPLGSVRRRHGAVHPLAALGRHELVRCRDAFLHHHGPGRISPATTPASATGTHP
jgi:hypothetical protein